MTLPRTPRCKSQPSTACPVSATRALILIGISIPATDTFCLLVKHTAIHGVYSKLRVCVKRTLLNRQMPLPSAIWTRLMGVNTTTRFCRKRQPPMRQYTQLIAPEVIQTPPAVKRAIVPHVMPTHSPRRPPQTPPKHGVEMLSRTVDDSPRTLIDAYSLFMDDDDERDFENQCFSPPSAPFSPAASPVGHQKASMRVKKSKHVPPNKKAIRWKLE